MVWGDGAAPQNHWQLLGTLGSPTMAVGPPHSHGIPITGLLSLWDQWDSRIPVGTGPWAVGPHSHGITLNAGPVGFVGPCPPMGSLTVIPFPWGHSDCWTSGICGTSLRMGPWTVEPHSPMGSLTVGPPPFLWGHFDYCPMGSLTVRPPFLWGHSDCGTTGISGIPVRTGPWTVGPHSHGIPVALGPVWAWDLYSHGILTHMGLPCPQSHRAAFSNNQGDIPHPAPPWQLLAQGPHGVG